ncbi:MAG: glycosyltransferase family 4 protein [Bacteroidales bacterium]|nr:glycosyltransferase family 4 protein [Bacteroidales bacterium]
MRVAHVVWGLNYGGIETMLVNIVNQQIQLGADAYIVVLNNQYAPTLIEKLDFRVKVILGQRGQNSKNPGLISWFNHVLTDISPDVIHFHSSKAIGLLKRSMRSKAVVTLHDVPRGLTRNRYLPSFISNQFLIFNLWGINNGCVGNIDKFNKVFAISKAVKTQLQEKYGIHSKLIYNGILSGLFKPRSLHTPTDFFRIVQVGRLDYAKKGQDLLLKALTKLPNNVVADFIGEGPDLEELKRMAKDLGLEARVNWLGTKTQEYLYEHLRDYDLFVQPSRFEGFGLTVAEAMAAQVPTIVSSGEGPEEVTQGERFGWVFKSEDVDSLVEKIQWIYNHYQEALEKAAKGREHILSNFDVKATAKNYLASYLFEESE